MQSNVSHRVFIAGATGYVGRQLVRLCCESGLETHAHIRPSSRSEYWQQTFADLGAVPIVTAWEQESMQSVLRSLAPTLVCSLLGTTKSAAKQEGLTGDVYETVDYQLTKILMNACLELSELPRFMYLSCIGASTQSGSPYLRVRGRIEDELCKDGFSFVAARPAIITGPDRDDDRRWERAGARIGDSLLRVGALFGARRVEQRYRSTTATELAVALLRLALTGWEGVAEGSDLRVV